MHAGFHLIQILILTAMVGTLTFLVIKYVSMPGGDDGGGGGGGDDDDGGGDGDKVCRRVDRLVGRKQPPFSASSCPDGTIKYNSGIKWKATGSKWKRAY